MQDKAIKECPSSRTKLFEVIETMRFPLIFLVVIIHMVGFDSPRIDFNGGAWSFYIFISEMFSHNLGRIAIPLFFIFSGYFFFRKLAEWTWDGYATQLKKKVKTLLIPYLFWNLTIVGVTLTLTYLTAYLGMNREIGTTSSLYDIFWGMPANFPLWYMRDLMCMMVLSPLLYLFIRYAKAWEMLCLLVVYLYCLEMGIPGLSTTAFFFFMLGGYFAIFNKDVIVFCGRYKKVLAVFTLLLLFNATLLNGTAYHEYAVRVFIIAGVMSAINLFNYLLRYPKLKQRLLSLSASTFFIYVVHEIYIINWLKGGFSRLPIAQSPWGMLVGYFVIPCICLLICWGLYKILKIIAPGVLSFTTGGRMVSNVKKEK